MSLDAKLQNEGVWTVAVAGSLNGDGFMSLRFFSEQAAAQEYLAQLDHEGTECICFEGKPELFNFTGSVVDEKGTKHYLHSLKEWFTHLQVKQRQEHELFASDCPGGLPWWRSPGIDSLIGFYDDNEDAYHYVTLRAVKESLGDYSTARQKAMHSPGARQAMVVEGLPA